MTDAFLYKEVFLFPVLLLNFLFPNYKLPVFLSKLPISC